MPRKAEPRRTGWKLVYRCGPRRVRLIGWEMNTKVRCDGHAVDACVEQHPSPGPYWIRRTHRQVDGDRGGRGMGGRLAVCVGGLSVDSTERERAVALIKTRNCAFSAARCGAAYVRARAPPTPTNTRGPLGGSMGAARTRGSWPNAPPTARTAQNGRKWRFG